MKNVFIIAFLSFLPSLIMAQDTLARPAKVILDKSGKLTSAQIKTLSDLSEGLQRTRKTMGWVLVVDTVPAGQTVMAYAKGIFKKWNLNNDNDGMNFIIIYVRKENGIRIEASDKIVTLVTKDYMRRVIAESMIPLLKQSKEFEALKKGMEMMVKQIVNNE
ncbi:MAG: TPM domain-containing protein [Bacteroidetes bacterium]|nr:TPM domain-containing protein [Bacteroidota bacterium]